MDKPDKGKVLLIDEDANALKILKAIIAAEGYDVLLANSAERGIRLARQNPPNAVIAETRFDNMSALELLEKINIELPEIPVILLTAYGSIDSAVRCMTAGARYYFVKPPDYKELLGELSHAVEDSRTRKEVLESRPGYNDGNRPMLVFGKTALMKAVAEIIDSVKNSESNVLVVGETGTGKELIARSVHFRGRRSYRPFVAVNCAAIPRDLIEAELFGHEKGAFTGASSRRVGRIESASGGTLFLDEIGELDITVQSKLLRVLQEKEFSRLGDNSSIEVDFRLIASTNRDLRQEVERGSFREDLYYRLNVVQISVPSLRERRGDISVLANEFLGEFCAREKKHMTITKEAMRYLESYRWPGNVRELRNTIERVVVLSKTRTVRASDLPGEISGPGRRPEHGPQVQKLSDAEARVISDALLSCDGNKSLAARLLGVSRKTLYKKIEDYKIC